MPDHQTRMQQAVEAGYQHGRQLRKQGLADAELDAAIEAQNPHPEAPLRTAWSAGCRAAFQCRLKPPSIPDPLSPGGEFIVR